MPYEGTCPLEAWEFWFDEPPTADVRRCLEQRGTRHTAAEIINAIEITGLKVPLIQETEERLKYMSAVLRRRSLKDIDRWRADEEATIDFLRKRWLTRRIGEWKAPRHEVREWLRWVTGYEIATLVRVSDDWQDFAQLVTRAVNKRRQDSGPATATVVQELFDAARSLRLVRQAPARAEEDATEE